MNRSDIIEELEMLAKWRGFLEGRAISLEERIGSSPRRVSGERPSIVDEHANEVRAALRAHQTLAQLRQQGSKARAHAQLLEQYFVISGEEARRRASRATKGLVGALRRKKLELKLEAALDAYRGAGSLASRERREAV
jgi:hypothetical protein